MSLYLFKFTLLRCQPLRASAPDTTTNTVRPPNFAPVLPLHAQEQNYYANEDPKTGCTAGDVRLADLQAVKNVVCAIGTKFNLTVIGEA